MTYSQGQISGTISSIQRLVNIPEEGNFKAGSVLCNQLTTSLYNSVVSEASSLDNQGEPKGVKQFSTDIGRCESLSMVDESGTKNVINRPGSTEKGAVNDHALDAVNKLCQFTDENLFFQNAILSTCNQTIGNTFNYTLKSGQDDNLRARTGIGFPNPSISMLSDQSYELKRVSGQTVSRSEVCDDNRSNRLPDYFMLTIKQKGITDRFFLRNEESFDLSDEKKSDPTDRPDPTERLISLDKPVAFEDSISIKITPNKDFDIKKAQDANNFPFSLEVTDFTNSYHLAVPNS